jgi:hypothetical protein
MPAPRHTLPQLEAALLKYGSMRKAAAALGYNNHSVLQRSLHRQRRTQACGAPAPALVFKSLDDVIAPHDVVAQALAFVRQIPPGKVADDDDVRRELNIGHSRWRRVRGSVSLAGHFYVFPNNAGCVWGGKSAIAAIANRMKELT